ncbi:CLUMA_CG007739, isoform A [Clunio marinus]|uniref:CLUMA_CG007739, isoform A n=1 Tax=Clunio marinus TaxID=568069 RepID=A0A1J1I1L8_9DIPT|nr:CLUMA_CG007739, isoform A [Clunio marinus]
MNIVIHVRGEKEEIWQNINSALKKIAQLTMSRLGECSCFGKGRNLQCLVVQPVFKYITALQTKKTQKTFKIDDNAYIVGDQLIWEIQPELLGFVFRIYDV